MLDATRLVRSRRALEREERELTSLSAAQIKPRTFSNRGRCYQIGRIVPYCTPACQKLNYKGGWKHKESCGQPLQHATLVLIFCAEPSSVAALNIHLLNILRIAEAFPESPAVWWFVRPAVGPHPVRFNPLAVEESFDTAERDTERMIEIRTSAIYERDDDTLNMSSSPSSSSAQEQFGIARREDRPTSTAEEK